MIFALEIVDSLEFMHAYSFSKFINSLILLISYESKK